MSTAIAWGNWEPYKAKREVSAADMFNTEFERQMKVDNAVRSGEDIVAEFDKRSDEIKKVIGVDLGNPLRLPVEPAQTDAMGGVMSPGGMWADHVAAYNTKLKELAQKHPEHATIIRADETPDLIVAKRKQGLEQRSADLTEQAGLIEGREIPVIGRVPVVRDVAALGRNLVVHPINTLAQFGGSLYAQAHDPVEAGMSLLGFGAGKAANSILKTALKNAASNAAMEAMMQPLRQEQRKNAGLDYGWERALMNIEGAAAAGAVLDAAVRGPYRAAITRIGRDVPEGQMFSRQGRGGWLTDAIPQTEPIKPVVREQITPEELEKARAGDITAVESIARKTGAIEDPTVKGLLDYAKTGAVIDDAMVARFKQMGIDHGEGMHMLSNLIGMEGKGYVRAPDPIPEARAALDEAGAAELAPRVQEINQRIAEAPQAIREAVQAGIGAGLPEIVKAARAALSGDLDGMRKAIDEAGGADLVADRVTVHTATNPIAVAKALRRSPEAMDSSVPMRTDFMRTARALAALDDAAFDMVLRGQAHPLEAQLVADMVPPGHHAETLRKISSANFRTIGEVKEAVRELAPEDSAAPQTASRIDDPSGPQAKEQVADLEKSLAAEVEEATAPIKRREELESKVETLKGEIAKLEEQQGKATPKPSAEREYIDPETGQTVPSGDIEAIANMAEYVAEMRRVPKPESLTSFLIKSGRVKDESGELTTMLGGKSRQLISGKGLPLDRAALLAWEQGFIDSAERPTVRQLLELLDEDIRGNRVVRLADRSIMDDLAVAREMETDLERLGLKAGASRQEIEAYFSGGNRQGGEGSSATPSQRAIEGEQLYALSEPQKERLDRARQAGFDTSRVLYHGTGNEIDAFSLRRAQDKEGRARGLGLGKGKIYLTANQWSASEWALQAPSRGLGSAPNVIPVFVRGKLLDEKAYQAKFAELAGGRQIWDSTLTMLERDALIAKTDEWAKSEGYAGIQQAYRNQAGDILEVGQVAIFDPSNIRSVNADFDPAKSSSPKLMAALSPDRGKPSLDETALSPADKKLLDKITERTGLEPDQIAEQRAQGQSFGKRADAALDKAIRFEKDEKAATDIATKRAELRQAERELEQLQMEQARTIGDSAMFRMVMERAAIQRQIDVRRAIDDALSLGDRILPENTRVEVRTDEMRDPVSGALLDASSDTMTGDIALASYAMNPAGRMGHEGLHTLVTKGHVSPQEVKLLAKLARERGLFKDEARYREAYAGRDNLDALIDEEAAAHAIEARINGTDIGPANTMADRIKQLIERIRNALDGYGFKTADDVARAIIDGEAAHRTARAEWMRGEVREKMREAADRGVTLPDGTNVKGVPLYAIRAYHGSPHDFDRFDLSKIGTGEGAQAYGHGLYFAENDDVARQYLRKLADADATPGWFRDQSGDVDFFNAPTGLALLRGERRANLTNAELIQSAQQELARAQGVKNQQLRDVQTRKAQAVLDYVQGNPTLRFDWNPATGRMYEVNIKADPNDFLDWDKPLSQQSEKVRGAAFGTVPSDKRAYFEKWASDPEVTARDVYEQIGGAIAPGDGKTHASPKVASALREAGIPGIKYLDQGSRGAGEGSRNYVVFDDSLIEIVAKDGKPVKSEAMFAMRSEPLDMSPEARKARAEQMGFDTSKVWYHGASRSDRIADAGKFDPKRATSGPMAFFTDDPTIASNYAKGKADTSLNDDGDISKYFTVSPKDVGDARGRTPYSVEQTWYRLPPEQRSQIAARAKRVGYENPQEATGPLTLHSEGTDASLNGDHFDYILRTEARGNVLTALRIMWHDSGELFGQPEAMMDIWRLAGYPHKISEKTAPWYEAQGVLPVYMKMKNPLDTSDMASLSRVADALDEAFKRDRTRLKEYGADGWDKNSRYTPRDWVKTLKDDIAAGKSSFVFTSIPDKVTEQLRALGYDGIIDRGGKMGGAGHDVAIPFDPQQVRSVNAEFDPSQSGSAKLLAAMRSEDAPEIPPLKSDMAIVDRLNSLKELIEACR